MPNITHIISDLHLCASRPDLLQLFEKFMLSIAPESDHLYVLGDLFEVWIGDDCLLHPNPNSQLYQRVIALFKDYSDHQGQLFFMHGNRDFLLSSQFETVTGGKILKEPFMTNWFGHKIALMHGDSLCIDDIAYQEFRTMVRNPKWQAEFLNFPMQQRVEIANNLRQQSQQAQTTKSNEIMDVNPKAVVQFFEESQIDWLIHGHTHRQATHSLEIQGQTKQRVVLSDWDQQGFYLAISEQGLSEFYFC